MLKYFPSFSINFLSYYKKMHLFLTTPKHTHQATYLTGEYVLHYIWQKSDKKLYINPRNYPYISGSFYVKIFSSFSSQHTNMFTSILKALLYKPQGKHS